MLKLEVRKTFGKLEPLLVVLLLLYAEAIDFGPSNPLNLPGNIQQLLNQLTYPIVGLLILNRWKQMVAMILRDPLLWVLLTLVMVSFVWSASPSISLDESKACLRITLLGVFIALRFSLQDQIRLVGWVCGIAAVLSLISVVVFPEYGIQPGIPTDFWKGIYGHKQNFGRMMTLGIITFVVLALSNRKHRGFLWLAAGLCFMLLWFASSKTGLMLLALAVSIIPLKELVKQHYRTKALLLVASVLIAGSVAFLLFTHLETIIVDVLGRTMDLSGRLPIWTEVIKKGMERPWLGYGYQGFWTSEESSIILRSTWAIESVFSKTRFHSHNGFIDLFIQLGFIGLGVFILHLTVLSLKLLTLFHVSKTTESFWMLQILILMVLFNLSETITIVPANQIFWILYVSLSTSVTLQLSQIEDARKMTRQLRWYSPTTSEAV